jgi:deoxyguanosine kinase
MPNRSAVAPQPPGFIADIEDTRVSVTDLKKRAMKEISAGSAPQLGSPLCYNPAHRSHVTRRMSPNESSSAKRAPVPTRGPQAPRFIVIEGPLRVGKSTLAKILAERLHARRVYDCEDNPFLADFYKEKPGSALRAQMYFLMERQKRLREALAIEAPGPVISDFLMEKDRIFANLNLDDEELKLYERYYEALAAELPAPDLVIYLQAKPEVLRARIAKKASREETQISLEYIEELARAYEHFFFRYAASDLLVINTSEIDFVERSADLQQLLRRLQDPVKGTQYFLPLGPSE